MKTCIMCSKEKEDSQFYNLRYKNGIIRKDSYCISCKKELSKKQYQLAYHDKDSKYDSYKESRKKAYKKYALSEKGRKSIKKSIKNYLLKTKYGITLEEYDSMVKKQENKCLICGSDNGSIELSVDHNHLTGGIRGLLCTSCNVGIGCFKDSPELLQKAISYLSPQDK